MTDDRGIHPSTRGREQRPWLRLPALAALLLVLVGVVALASRGHRGPGGRAAGPPEHLWDYFISAYLTIGVFFFLFLIWALFSQRQWLPERRRASDAKQILVFATVLLALGLLVSANPGLLERLRLGADGRSGESPAVGGPSGGRSRGPELEERREPRWRWAPAMVLGAIVVGGAITYAAVGRGARPERSRAEVAESLAEALDDAVDQLRAEHDPRAAIISAYARLETLLAAHGVPRRPSEAPFEYLARVLIELETKPGAVFELTDLFERAKFSHHAIDASMKDDAIDALVAVRDELRGRT